MSETPKRFWHDERYEYGDFASPTGPREPDENLPSPLTTAKEEAAQRGITVDEVLAERRSIPIVITGPREPEPTPELVEQISAVVHDAWMEQQRRDGNASRLSKGGEEMMVPYAQLSDSCKEYDRVTVRAVLHALQSLGLAAALLHSPKGRRDADA